MNKVTFPNTNGLDITIAGLLNLPADFDETKTYPAVVVSHPGGGVKEQTAGTYARKLAEQGFVAIAYDASYQGESTGEPRQLENPHVRTEDVSAVIDYLTTLPYVDNDRIGAMGICAGAGYTANAAINDRRIKAVGTVSMVNIGQMFRNGWDNNVKDSDAIPYIQAGSDSRTSDAGGNEIATIPMAPLKEEDAPNEELRHRINPCGLHLQRCTCFCCLMLRAPLGHRSSTCCPHCCRRRPVMVALKMPQL